MFRTGRSKDSNVENGPFYGSRQVVARIHHPTQQERTHNQHTHSTHTQLTQHPDTRKAFRVRSSLARFRDRLSQPPLSLLRFVAAEGICKIQCSRRALPVFTLARPMGRDPSKASFCNSRCRRDRHRRRQGRRTHPLISRAQKV